MHSRANCPTLTDCSWHCSANGGPPINSLTDSIYTPAGSRCDLALLDSLYMMWTKYAVFRHIRRSCSSQDVLCLYSDYRRTVHRLGGTTIVAQHRQGVCSGSSRGSSLHGSTSAQQISACATWRHLKLSSSLSWDDPSTISDLHRHLRRDYGADRDCMFALVAMAD